MRTPKRRQLPPFRHAAADLVDDDAVVEIAFAARNARSEDAMVSAVPRTCGLWPGSTGAANRT